MCFPQFLIQATAACHSSIPDSPRKKENSNLTQVIDSHIFSSALQSTWQNASSGYLSNEPKAQSLSCATQVCFPWLLDICVPTQQAKLTWSPPRLFLLSQWLWPGYPSNFSARQWAATIPSTTKSETPSKFLSPWVFSFCHRTHFEFSFHLYITTVLSLFNNSLY